ACALQHAGRRADDHRVRQVRQPFVVVERSLRKQRRPLLEGDPRRARATALESKSEEPVFADRTGGHLRRLIPIRRKLRGIVEELHARFGVRVRAAAQFMNIRTCDLTWTAARISAMGANAAMSSRVAFATRQYISSVPAL